MEEGQPLGGMQGKLQLDAVFQAALQKTMPLQSGGGGRGSKYFRMCSRGEHLTIEFENLVESNEGKRC